MPSDAVEVHEEAADDVNVNLFYESSSSSSHNLASSTRFNPRRYSQISTQSHSIRTILRMRPSFRLLASPVTPPFKPGTANPKLAVLPPIPLYRRLLRTHRKKLGSEERIMGDLYLKDEFRRHRNIDNPIHIIGFLSQWQQYGELLEGDDWKEKKLDMDLLDKMSDQQIGQMYELMQAIQKRGRDSADEEIEGALYQPKKE